MRLNNFAILFGTVLILLSIGVVSQLSTSIKEDSKTSQVTSELSIEEKSICTTTSKIESVDVWGECILFDNYTTCTNVSGPNTGCGITQKSTSYSCITSKNQVEKNTTSCGPTSFVISNEISNKETVIDFASSGLCVKEIKNGCVEILCGTLEGGSARNGVFNGCDGGKSCQKFIFCEGKQEVLYKGAGEGFMEEDPTFRTEKITEVLK